MPVASLADTGDSRKPADVLVEAEALPAGSASGGEHLVWLDCRSQEDYEALHVRNARWVEIDRLKDMSLAVGALEKREIWTAWFRSHGTDGDSRVVIYDDGKMTDAVRLWFLLQYEGVRRVSVLNGGFVAIEAMLDDGRLPAGKGGLPPARAPTSDWAESGEKCSCCVRLADARAVRSALGRADTLILDVRTRAEYLGVDSRKNPRHGHLPHAVHISHTRLLEPIGEKATTQPATRSKGRLKSPGELRQLFKKASITPDRRVITYCQSGGRSALAALALVRAGYGDVSNYYTSFGEWSADKALPLVEPKSATVTSPAPD